MLDAIERYVDLDLDLIEMTEDELHEFAMDAAEPYDNRRAGAGRPADVLVHPSARRRDAGAPAAAPERTAA